jgi:polyisoprenyl-teichoic acid--peptidoglycan teichoic acid transferase
MYQSISLTKRLSFASLIFILTACSFPLGQAAPLYTPVPTDRAPLVSAAPDASPTATPFQPLDPTPTVFPTQWPTGEPSPTPVPPTPTPPPPAWGEYPGPSESPSIAIPPPAPKFPKPDGQVNILLFGSDQRLGTSGFRTDTIILVTLNPAQGTASLTSFPRDLFVYIPGWTMQRVNTAHPRGGFNTTALTFEYNFGVRPDYYILVNFWSFVQIIDSLGGIDVQVGSRLSDHRHGYGEYSVGPGPVNMDGETALWYVRSRYTSSDFERTRRQQEVIKAIFLRLLSLNAVGRASDLYSAYQQNVITNMSFTDIAPLLPLAVKLSDTSRLSHYYISRREVTGWRTPQGAAVLLPNRDTVLEVMRQALSVP